MPNINGLPPVSPVDYSVVNDRYYAFATPDGLTCAFETWQWIVRLQRAHPERPEWSETWSAAVPVANRALPTPTPRSSRHSARSSHCRPTNGSATATSAVQWTGAGTTICTNQQDQAGFVLTPAGQLHLWRRQPRWCPVRRAPTRSPTDVGRT